MSIIVVIIVFLKRFSESRRRKFHSSSTFIRFWRLWDNMIMFIMWDRLSILFDQLFEKILLKLKGFIGEYEFSDYTAERYRVNQDQICTPLSNSDVSFINFGEVNLITHSLLMLHILFDFWEYVAIQTIMVHFVEYRPFHDFGRMRQFSDNLMFFIVDQILLKIFCLNEYGGKRVVGVIIKGETHDLIVLE